MDAALRDLSRSLARPGREGGGLSGEGLPTTATDAGIAGIAGIEHLGRRLLPLLGLLALPWVAHWLTRRTWPARASACDPPDLRTREPA